MRFISIEKLVVQAREAAVRFPVVLLCALLVAAAAIGITARGDDEQWVRLLMAALPGLPLFTALATTGERAAWGRRQRAIIYLAAVAGLIGLWYALGQWSEVTRMTRIAHLLAGAHLAVAVLPFIGTTLLGAFWQYNRALFLRFLTASIFAAVLFAGLALALVAIDKLFGVNVDDEWYVRLWIVIAFVFHPWFFLGGVPTDLAALESREDYPAGLKVFAQFILVPVVSVYLLILTAYLGRVIATRTWPSGWIGNLVSSVAAAGTLALLLVHPVRQRADSRWVDVYGRWFFIVLLPSVGMLLMAVWLRVDQYGVTERRYFLAVLALWLGGIAVYYGLTASRNIRLIPATLGAVAVATFFGPWSAYAVSRESQLGRLRALLANHELLAGETVQPAPRPVPYDARREMSGALRYLIEVHGARSLAAISPELQRFAERPLPRDRDGSSDPPRAVMERLGLRYVGPWEQLESERVTSFFADIGSHPIALDGYDWITRGNLATTFTVIVGTDTIAFAPDSLPARVIASRRGARLEIPLWPLLARADTAVRSDTLSPGREPRGIRPRPAGPNSPAGPPPLFAEATGAGMSVRLVIVHLNGVGDSTSSRISSADAMILLRLRP